MAGIPGVDEATLPPSNGRAFSIVCGREGAAVAVHNRSIESAEATAALVRAEKDCPKAVAIPGDVTGEFGTKQRICWVDSKSDSSVVPSRLMSSRLASLRSTSNSRRGRQKDHFLSCRTTRRRSRRHRRQRRRFKGRRRPQSLRRRPRVRHQAQLCLALYGLQVRRAPFETRWIHRLDFQRRLQHAHRCYSIRCH